MNWQFTIGMALGLFVGNWCLYYFLHKMGFWQSTAVGALTVVVFFILWFGYHYLFK